MSGLLIRALIPAFFVLLGCASQPLRTTEAVPHSSCPARVQRVGLFGFEEKDPQLSERLATLFTGATSKVEHFPLTAFFDVEGPRQSQDVGVALLDSYSHIKSNASARRYTNMYFTFTVIDIWILPILHSTDLFESSAELEAEIGVFDAVSGDAPRRATQRASVQEKPTGYFGPSDKEFTRMMVERATQHLAVAIYADVCRSPK